MQKPFLSKSDKTNQKKFIESIEGLGDVLVFLTKRRKNAQVIKGLKEMEDLFDLFIDLKNKNPEKFERLILSDEYWSIFQKNKEEAKLRLSFQPSKYLPPFNLLVQQVIRIFEISIDINNEEITRESSYQLILFLKKVSEISQFELVVKEILNKLLSLSKISVEKKSSASRALVYEWYTEIVFQPQYGRIKYKFLFEEYLELFNSYLLFNIKYLIDNGEFKVFWSLVHYFIDGLHTSSLDLSKTWDYSHLLPNEEYRDLLKETKISEVLNGLSKYEGKIFSKEDFDDWNNHFKELKSLVYKKLNKQAKKEANKLEKKIRRASVVCHLDNSLKRVLFLAGAWAVYRGKPKYVHELLYSKQPRDTSVNYIGGFDIYPKDISGVIEFFFKSSPESLAFFWDGHHEGKIYCYRYLIVLLIKYLREAIPYTTTPTNNDDSFNQGEGFSVIDEFNIPLKDINKLSSAKSVGEKLLEEADYFRKEKFCNFLVNSELAENVEDVTSLIEKRLKPFLTKLVQSSETNISNQQTSNPISGKKVFNFKKELYETYIKNSTLSSFLKEHNKVKYEINSKSDSSIPLLGFHNKLDKREVFFDEWHVHFVDWGEHYGRELAYGENESVLNKILKNLEFNKSSGLEELLSSITISEDTVIFCSSEGLFEDLRKNDLFTPYWKLNTTQERKPNFLGEYDYESNKIEVYNFYSKDYKNYLAVFNISSIGELIYKNPLSEKDENESLYESLKITVSDLQTNHIEMERWLGANIEWLEEKGNKEKQREYLNQFVVLQIGVKPDYQPSKKIQGSIFIGN